MAPTSSPLKHHSPAAGWWLVGSVLRRPLSASVLLAESLLPTRTFQTSPSSGMLFLSLSDRREVISCIFKPLFVVVVNSLGTPLGSAAIHSWPIKFFTLPLHSFTRAADSTFITCCLLAGCFLLGDFIIGNSKRLILNLFCVHLYSSQAVFFVSLFHYVPCQVSSRLQRR